MPRIKHSTAASAPRRKSIVTDAAEAVAKPRKAEAKNGAWAAEDKTETKQAARRAAMMNASNDQTAKMAQNMKTMHEDMHRMTDGFMEAATASAAAALQGMSEMTRNMGEMMRQSFGHCMSTSKTLLSAKTPQEMADIQSTYVKECMDSAMTGSGTLSEISARAARESMEPLTRHANDTVGLMMQKTKAA